MNYPLFLKLKGKKVVVFGSGVVASRKAKTLLACGASVNLVSPKQNKMNSILKKVVLAIVASPDRRWNEKIAAICRKKKIWVNVADRPDLCDFYAPSFIKKGNLMVAISTGGTSPLLAKKFRQELSTKIRPEAIKTLATLGRLRKSLPKKLSSQKARKKFLISQIHKDFHFLKDAEL